MNKISDTERLDFIIENEADVYSGLLMPDCRCLCCQGYKIEINDKEYWEDSLRGAIDKAIEDNNNMCPRKV